MESRFPGYLDNPPHSEYTEAELPPSVRVSLAQTNHEHLRATLYGAPYECDICQGTTIADEDSQYLSLLCKRCIKAAYKSKPLGKVVEKLQRKSFLKVFKEIKPDEVRTIQKGLDKLLKAADEYNEKVTQQVRSDYDMAARLQAADTPDTESDNLLAQYLQEVEFSESRARESKVKADEQTARLI
jgi:hypothetical protein